MVFTVIFLIALYIFITYIKSYDLGILGKVYVFEPANGETTALAKELYGFIVVILVILGILAIREIALLLRNNKSEPNGTISIGKAQTINNSQNSKVPIINPIINENNHGNLVFDKDNLSLEKLIEMRSAKLITDEEFKQIIKKL